MRRSTVIKHSIVVSGHKTSVSLENAFWMGLKGIAKARNTTLAELVTAIGVERRGNLSSALRLFVLDHYRDLAFRQAVPIVAARATSDRPDALIVATE